MKKNKEKSNSHIFVLNVDLLGSLNIANTPQEQRRMRTPINRSLGGYICLALTHTRTHSATKNMFIFTETKEEGLLLFPPFLSPFGTAHTHT